MGSILRHEVHFWIGKESSQDEGAAAAMLAVELDNTLAEQGSQASISRWAVPTNGPREFRSVLGVYHIVGCCTKRRML